MRTQGSNCEALMKRSEIIPLSPPKEKQPLEVAFLF